MQILAVLIALFLLVEHTFRTPGFYTASFTSFPGSAWERDAGQSPPAVNVSVGHVAATRGRPSVEARSQVPGGSENLASQGRADRSFADLVPGAAPNSHEFGYGCAKTSGFKNPARWAALAGTFDRMDEHLRRQMSMHNSGGEMYRIHARAGPCRRLCCREFSLYSGVCRKFESGL
jgi:hypothetical protein